MKRFIIPIAAALTLVCLLAGAPAARADKDGREKDAAPPLLPPGSRVAVVAASSTGGGPVDRVVGDMMITALSKAGIHVIERQLVDRVAVEQKLVRDGIVDPATAAPAGRVLGVDYLLSVKATEFGVKEDRVGTGFAFGPVAGFQVRTNTAHVVLDARLIAVKTGAVLITCNGEGKLATHGATVVGGYIGGWNAIGIGAIDINSKDWSESLLGKAARKAVDTIAKKLGASFEAGTGTVLAVLPNGDVIVSLGGFDHVHVGDRLKVTQLDVQRDSKGDAIWTNVVDVGEVRITEVRADRSRATAVDGKLPLTEGLRVQVMRAGKYTTGE